MKDGPKFGYIQLFPREKRLALSCEFPVKVGFIEGDTGGEISLITVPSQNPICGRGLSSSIAGLDMTLGLESFTADEDDDAALLDFFFEDSPN